MMRGIITMIIVAIILVFAGIGVYHMVNEYQDYKIQKKAWYEQYQKEVMANDPFYTPGMYDWN